MYYIGVDVSKKKLDICLVSDAEPNKRKTKSIPNNPNSINAFLTWIRARKCRLEELLIIIEPTNTYHEAFCYQLYQAGIALCVVNSYRVREFARGIGILTKNDAVDSYVLARFGALADPSRWHPPPEEVRVLTALLRRRDSLLQDVLKERNRLENSHNTMAVEPVISSIHHILTNLEEELELIERIISEHIDNYPGLKGDMALLTSIKSVGREVGSNMLAIINSHQFECAEQLAAYLGLVPIERRSGSSVKGPSRLSRAGPPEMRSKLYMAALTAIRFNPHVKAVYDRLIAKGKAKMLALGAAMRKLVHLCYGVLHNQRPYDENYANCC